MLAGTIARLLILWRWRQEKNLNAFYGWFAEDNTVITTGTCLIANCLRNLEAAKKKCWFEIIPKKENRNFPIFYHLHHDSLKYIST